MKNLKSLSLLLIASGLVLTGCGGGGDTSSSSKSSDSDVKASSSSSEKTPEEDFYEFEDPEGKQGASGMYDFSQDSWQERSAILAEIENYAMRNHTAGIPLYDDAAYEVFSPRAFNGLPSKRYLTNYGWGVAHGVLDLDAGMADGKKIEDTETVEAYRPYFHTYTSTDSGTFNGWNSQGSDVSERTSMITSSYFGVKANSDNTAYYWIGSLSKDDEPIMLDAEGNPVTEHDADATSQRWRVRVHTGEGYTYHTASNSKFKKYDGQQVKLIDYLTPFKALLRNNLVRTTELLTDTGGFAGAMDYYYASRKGDYTEWPTDIGIQLNEEENAIDFTFIQPKSASFARTSLSSGLYSPLPAEFLVDIGNGNFDKGVTKYGEGIFNAGDHTDAFDNIIFFGPYMPIYWENGSRMVYQKVDDYFEANDYNYPGYTEDIYSGSNSDKDVWNAFKAGKLDEVALPSSALSEKDAYAATTLRSEGSTILKLNINSTTVDEWDYYFGKNGSVFPHAAGSEYAIKGIMSNESFLNGVFFSIDRSQLANAAGHNPALSYLSNAYMIDPSGTTSYRQSKWGQAVTQYWIDEAGGDPYAHSRSMAEACFDKAGRELIENGIYDAGDTIEVNITWRYQTTIDNLGSYVEKYIEEAFNTANAGRQLKIDVSNVLGGNTYTETYTLMDHGEFDFAEGAITGNVLNPLDFMSTISTNVALNQGFCLNWGHRTDLLLDPTIDQYDGTVDKPYGHPICYKGELWSYDALWNASQGFTAVDEGISTAVAEDQQVEKVGDNLVWSAAYSTIAVNSDGTSVYTFEPQNIALLYGETSACSDGGYYYNGATFDGDKKGITGRVTLTFPIADVTKLARQVNSKAKYFCMYFTLRYTVTVKDEATGVENKISKSILVQTVRSFAEFGITL